MQKFLFLILVIIVSITSVFSQVVADSTYVDSKYREDQFYVAVTYNLLVNKPVGVTQQGFPTGFHLGFIRDFPINKKRNLAFGLGIGISSNSYNSNILISESNGIPSYTIIDETFVNFTKNKFTMYLVEVPLEFRWRTSTAKDYKFWRIYTGVKFGYVLFNSIKFRGSSGNVDVSNLKDFNTFQYGLTLSAGYSTFNFHVYYSLNNVFNKNATLNSQSIDLSIVKIGLIAYIL